MFPNDTDVVARVALEKVKEHDEWLAEMAELGYPLYGTRDLRDLLLDMAKRIRDLETKGV